jgi:hypothetical protein
MTARNSVLLIIKQNNGLEYNSLLNKIKSNYSSLNSARAALSRTLKDLNAFGLIKRQSNHIFITAKGAAQISSEMKSKLLIKLNQTVQAKNSYLEIDSIVKNLHTLIERSKEDTDLLKAAKGSAEFYLANLRTINRQIKERAKHLQYIDSVLAGQIKTLEELGFNDLISLELSPKNVKKLQETIQKSSTKDFFVQCNSAEWLEKISKTFKAKIEKNGVTLHTQKFPKLLEFAQAQAQDAFNPDQPLRLTVFLPKISLNITGSKINVVGPAPELKQF